MRRVLGSLCIVALSLAGCSSRNSNRNGNSTDGGSDGGGADAGDAGQDGGGITCKSYCPAVLAANCPNGPVDEADCEQGCAIIESMCGSQFDALEVCAGATPTVSCDANGYVTFPACKGRYDALGACAAGG